MDFATELRHDGAIADSIDAERDDRLLRRIAKIQREARASEYTAHWIVANSHKIAEAIGDPQDGAGYALVGGIDDGDATIFVYGSRSAIRRRAQTIIDTIGGTWKRNDDRVSGTSYVFVSLELRAGFGACVTMQLQTEAVTDDDGNMTIRLTAEGE